MSLSGQVPGRLKSSLHFGCMVPRLLEQNACKFNCPECHSLGYFSFQEQFKILEPISARKPDRGSRGMEAMLDHEFASFTGQTLHGQQSRPHADVPKNCS
ncbi:hypothetical protein QQP08_003838 [Theobroma cacao]|nr:hypothetical protein QQP08_003838 [Theobroma cacao]